MGKKSSVKIVKVNISEVSICNTYNHKTVGFYLVESTISEGEEKKHYQVYHHFQEFRDLHSAILSEFSKDHIKDKLPDVPPKEITWFTDHTNPVFLDRRKKLLKQYIKELAKVPRVDKSDTLLNFLGYFKKGIREASVLFNGDLGIRIEPSSKDYHVSVMAFTRTKDGKIGSAEKSGLIYMKDLICNVNGESTHEKTFEEVKAMIALSGRPIVLTFRGNPNKAPEAVIVEKEDRKESDDESGSGSDSGSDSDRPKKSKKSAKKPKKVASDSESDSGSDSESEEEKPKKTKKDGKKSPIRKIIDKLSPKKKPKKPFSFDDGKPSDSEGEEEDKSKKSKKKPKKKIVLDSESGSGSGSESDKPAPPPPKKESKKKSKKESKPKPEPKPIPVIEPDLSSDSDNEKPKKISPPPPPKTESKPLPQNDDDDDDGSDSDRIVVKKRGGNTSKPMQASDSSDSDIDPSV